MLIPASCLKSSPVTCAPEMLPTEPKRSSPGLARASAISSFTVVAGTEGCTTRLKSDVAKRLTGAKSRSVSYGRLGTAPWTTAFGGVVGVVAEARVGAVGGRLGRVRAPVPPPRPAAIIHDEAPAKIVGQRLRDDARRHVRPASRGCRNDQADRPGGIRLRGRSIGQQGGGQHPQGKHRGCHGIRLSRQRARRIYICHPP